MKKISLLVPLAILALAACTTQDGSHLRLQGTVVGQTEGMVYLQKFDNKLFTLVDSAAVVDGQFSFSSAVELPELYGLSLSLEERSPYLVFLDEGEISVSLDPSDWYRHTQVTGSAPQDLFNAYHQLGEDLAIDSFIREHPTSIVSAYALYRDFSYRLSPDELEADIALIDPSLHETSYVKILRQIIATVRQTSPGAQAPDFTVPDADGNPVSLYSLLGNSYLLIDFWASWCGPCRRENPNVVRAYQAFHDKGFDILGVSLDQKKDNWLQAIEADGLTWHHVSELTYWNSSAANLYGVRAIPSNILLDKDGIIVARNLTGEALQEKLAELYGR